MLTWQLADEMDSHSTFGTNRLLNDTSDEILNRGSLGIVAALRNQ